MKRAHEIRAAGNRVACYDSSADPRQELLAGYDLLSHEMPTALRLHLVLDVHACDTGADILPHCARNIRRSTESAKLVQS